MEKINVGIITFPISESGNTPLLNLIDIVCSFSQNVNLITGNEGFKFFKNDKRINVKGVEHRAGLTSISRVGRYLWTQLIISYYLLKMNVKTDLWLFFIGGDTLILPMLTAKVLRKKVIIIFAGSYSESLRYSGDNIFKLVEIISKINCNLSNNIIIYSKFLLKDLKLEKYRKKILISPRHFVDFDLFKEKIKFEERNNLIGYIGRFSSEKGTFNFVHSIPKILENRDDIKFFIGGDGQLRQEIEKYIEKENLNDKVDLNSWIPHEQLPDYLNRLKLIVIPSYTEGLPNIMLEAMACGTPVLATAVGGIPEIIIDMKTGYIMENNTLKCIADNITRVLDQSDLNKIVRNARITIEKEFLFENVVYKYKKFLYEIIKSK